MEKHDKVQESQSWSILSVAVSREKSGKGKSIEDEQIIIDFDDTRRQSDETLALSTGVLTGVKFSLSRPK